MNVVSINSGKKDTVSMDMIVVNPTKQASNIAVDYNVHLRRGFFAMFFLVFCIGGWAALFSIQGAVIAPGVVIVEGKPKTLQHLEGGVVREILVENGDKVKAGDVVLRLDPTEMKANNSLYEKRLYEALARLDRLKTERDGLQIIGWSPQLKKLTSRADVVEMMTGQENLFRARQLALKGQIGQLNQQIVQAMEQAQGLQNLIASKKEQQYLIRQELGGLRALLSKGFVSKTRILGLEREQARLQGEHGIHRSDIARVQSSISEIKIQILQLNKDNRTNILTEIREVSRLVSDTNEKLKTARVRLGRVEIISPVNGIVHNIEETTIGGVVTPGQPIMQIIPLNDRLVIAARISTADVDQVYEGQAASVALTAFSQRTTPQINGIVSKVSADSLIDKYTGAYYFNVLIELPDTEIKKLGNLTLLPGMPADSFIQTQKRTVLEYLFKPFTDQLSRTFREE